MAAFSYHFLDSVFLPNTSMKMSEFMQEGNINTNCVSQFYPPESVQEIPFDARLNDSSCLDNCSKVGLSDNEPSVTKKQSTDSSTMVDTLESGEQVTQKMTSVDKKRKNTNGFSSNSAQSKVACEGKGKKQKKGSNGLKNEENIKPKADKKNQKKVTEEPPTGYIHVRARRGQATDSHSLAERVRREKISGRMKILQHLVPGCDKVTGKALMLDEIINYVQSLQTQVEFLSMKLASSNPMLYDFGADFDELLIRPERLTNLASPLPSMPQCSPTTTTIAAATTFIAPGHQFQDNGNLLWDVEYQRQKFLSPSGLNNLSSFH